MIIFAPGVPQRAVLAQKNSYQEHITADTPRELPIQVLLVFQKHDTDPMDKITHGATRLP